MEVDNLYVNHVHGHHFLGSQLRLGAEEGCHCLNTNSHHHRGRRNLVHQDRHHPQDHGDQVQAG